MLEVQHLAKRYRQKVAVADVSLNIRQGEVVGLLGPNGAGKTTCFYMIVGLIPPDHGQISLAGKDITTLPMHRRAALGIGYLPQEASIFRRMTVRDNILAVLELRGNLGRAARKARCQELLDDLNITRIAASPARALSGGERRRLEIARALALEPSFMLLDEPFAGVDPISVKDIRGIVEHLVDRDIGVLITDHNVRETLKVCHRAYIVSNGAIIADGNPQQILNNEEVRAVYLGEDFTLV